jgi:hypothetical protein
MAGKDPLVTVVTPTTGNTCVMRALESVSRQTHKCIQHLVVCDGAELQPELKKQIHQYNVDVIELPYATGTDRFNGHRIYGASVFLGKGDFFCFLDEDNWFEPDHVTALLELIGSGGKIDWAFSLRKIVDADGSYVCNDDCESLGRWSSIIADSDFLVDVGCFFLPRLIAIQTAPIWYRKARERGVAEVDRLLTAILRANRPNYETTGLYTLNYRAGNTALSARKEFFLQGNERMRRKFNGQFPWRARQAEKAAEPAPMNRIAINQ